MFNFLDVMLSTSSVKIFAPFPSIIRGYNSSSFVLNGILRNPSTTVDIIELYGMASQNFLINTFLSTSNASSVNMSSQNIIPVVNVPTYPLSLSQQGLKRASNLTFNVTLPFGLLIPKQRCSQWIWLCLQIYPSLSASYRLPAGYISKQCINISSLVNCIGRKTVLSVEM